MRQTWEFFQLLYRDSKDGYLILWDDQSKKSQSYPLSKLEEAAKEAVNRAQATNLYFNVGLQEKALPKGLRGKAADVILLPGLWLDIDIQSTHHQDEKRPASMNDVQKLLATFPLPPSVMVETGGGVHCYWLFQEPLLLSTKEMWAKAESASKQFQNVFQQAAERFGWTVDGTADLARMLRPPGTLNHKPVKWGEEPLPVNILEQMEYRYSFDDIDQYLPCAEPVKASKQNDEYPSADLDRIFERCAFIRHCKEDAATLSEPEWFSMLGIIRCCVNGRELAHQWSEPYPGYSAEETDAKLDYLESGPYGARSCEQIRQKHGAYCRDCSESVRNPLHLGYSRDASEDFADELDVITEFLDKAAKDQAKPAELYAEELLGALAVLPEPELAAIKTQLKELFPRVFSVRDFDRAVKAAKREHLRVAGAGERPQDRLLELPALEQDLTQPDGWVVGREGIGRRFVDPDSGMPMVAPIAEIPMVVTAILEDIDTGSESLRLQWYEQGRWKERVVGRKVIANSRDVVALAEFSAPVTSGNAKDIVEYLTDFRSANIDRLPKEQVASQLGWLSGMRFFQIGHDTLGQETPVFFHGEGGSEDTVEAFQASGSLEEWKKAVEWAYPYLRVSAAVCASFAAPLLQIVHCPNFILDLGYATSSGKSTALRLAASVWGKGDERLPDSLISKWNATWVGIERRAGLFNGLPLMLDDSATVRRPKDLEDIVYMIASGMGRTRGAKAGGLDTTSRFHTIAISTGEERLTMYTQQGGATARVIGLWGPPFDRMDEETLRVVTAINRGCQEQFGTAGRAYIEYLLQTRSTWSAIREAWQICTQGLLDDSNVESAVVARLADYFGLLMVAGIKANEALGLELPNLLPLWKQVVEDSREADKATVALEQILGWADGHSQEFLGQGITDAYGNERPSGIHGWAGRWYTHDFGGTEICFFRHRLYQVLEELGHPPKAIVSQWAERGWLWIDDGRKTDKTVKFDGRAQRMIVLDPEAVELFREENGNQ